MTALTECLVIARSEALNANLHFSLLTSMHPPEPEPESEDGYGPDRGKPRWSLSNEGRIKMEEVYAMSRFPPTAVRERLAREVGGTLRQVQVWFQNRRQRDMTHRHTWQTPGYMMVGFNGAPGYYPSPDPTAMGGPYGQPVMYMQPPMVPMPGALQHIAPGPPSMPVPGAPGAVPMPNSPPMQAAPTNRTRAKSSLSLALISLFFR